MIKHSITFLMFFSAFGALNSYANQSRDLLIQKQLNCVEQHQDNGLSWQDVCSMPDPIDQRIQAIDQQLDELENKPQRSSSSTFNNRIHTFSINFQSFDSYFYRPLNQQEVPDDSFNNSRKLNGVWYGGGAKYTFRPAEDSIFNNPIFNYFAIDGLYAKGSNDVSQKVQSFVPGPDYFEKLNIKKIPGYMFESRILVGRDFTPLPYILQVTPYTGFGVRYKSDQAAGHQDALSDALSDPTIVLGYDTTDTYYYIPVGLTFDFAATQDYQISWNLEYDYLVKGYERDDYSNFDWNSNSPNFLLNYGFNFTNQNLEYTLTHGWGARTSLKFLRHVSLVDFYLEPYLRYWYIGTSRISSGNVGYNFNTNTQNFSTAVNKNFTLEAGASLGVEF